VRLSFSVWLIVPLVGRKSEVAMGGGRGLEWTSPKGGGGPGGVNSSLAVEASGAGPLGAVGDFLAIEHALPTIAFGVVGR
jgi:hypothetical protein